VVDFRGRSGPAGFRDRARFSIRLIAHTEPGKRIGLHDPAMAGKMLLGMDAGSPVSRRIEEYGSGRRGAAGAKISRIAARLHRK
jgi:hypothetical protein